MLITWICRSMLNQNKIVLCELFNSSHVYCKPQKGSSKQLINARNKDKGSWAFKQAEDKHTKLFLKNSKNNLTMQI